MDKLTILCISLSATGHTNATIGIATALRNRGHRIVFAAERSRKGMFSKLGFSEELYDESPVVEGSDGLPQLNELLIRMGKTLCKSALDCFWVMVEIFDMFFEHSKYSNDRIKEIVDKWNPNVIIEDRMIPTPALITTTIPLIKLCSLNPLYFFDDERLPAAFLGLPINDKTNWQSWRQITREMRSDNVRRVNEWLEKEDKNIPKLDLNREYVSTNLNLFMYPKALVDDYLKQYPEAMGEEWMRLDYCMRESRETFKIPEKLKNGPGKLIFVSMGTIGSSILSLMQKLVAIFAKSKHRFIFSKGHCEQTYELADNMWGEPYVPQLDILPLVDLVIFHGGNNTLVESLYFGKPVIILPLFADQFDNAQRVIEKKIGLTFNPFNVEENELIGAIEKLLSDSKEAKSAMKISQEMKASDCLPKVIERIEYVAKYPKFPTITGLTEEH